MSKMVIFGQKMLIFGKKLSIFEIFEVFQIFLRIFEVYLNNKTFLNPNLVRFLSIFTTGRDHKHTWNSFEYSWNTLGFFSKSHFCFRVHLERGFQLENNLC